LKSFGNLATGIESFIEGTFVPWYTQNIDPAKIMLPEDYLNDFTFMIRSTLLKERGEKFVKHYLAPFLVIALVLSIFLFLIVRSIAGLICPSLKQESSHDKPNKSKFD